MAAVSGVAGRCDWPVTEQPEPRVLQGRSTCRKPFIAVCCSPEQYVLLLTHPFSEELMAIFVFPRTERQYRDLSYCLTLLPLSERGLHKLQDNFDCFADKLQDPAVYSCFQTVLARFRRGGGKPEAKVRMGWGASVQAGEMIAFYTQ